jgi:hypothetical protein
MRVSRGRVGAGLVITLAALLCLIGMFIWGPLSGWGQLIWHTFSPPVATLAEVLKTTQKISFVNYHPEGREALEDKHQLSLGAIKTVKLLPWYPVKKVHAGKPPKALYDFSFAVVCTAVPDIRYRPTVWYSSKEGYLFSSGSTQPEQWCEVSDEFKKKIDGIVAKLPKHSNDPLVMQNKF